jgi:hypothetical protein
MYTSDAENLMKETARASSTSVDTRATEGDTVEEGIDEAGGGCIVETESEDDDPEATRRY